MSACVLRCVTALLALVAVLAQDQWVTNTWGVPELGVDFPMDTYTMRGDVTEMIYYYPIYTGCSRIAGSVFVRGDPNVSIQPAIGSTNPHAVKISRHNSSDPEIIIHVITYCHSQY